MATVFMKWLETRPADYDRGIRLLTLGKLRPLQERIAHQYVSEAMRVLEIGCGTGTLTALMAKRGAAVTALDASPAMLAQAEAKVAEAGLDASFHRGDASQVNQMFPPGSYDLIVAALLFSELAPEAQRTTLAGCRELLAPGGRLLIADEVLPRGRAARILYTLVRTPLAVLTWLLTRTTTAPLRDFEARLADAGFGSRPLEARLGGSLVLYEAAPREGGAAGAMEPPAGGIERLSPRVTLRSLLVDLWLLFFRIIPPYPKVRPGLYRLGDPGRDSPVLVTGNFHLTVRRLVRAVDGRADAWLLVADSAGINVWCGAGAGHFTAEKVISVLKSSRLEQLVSHRRLILPQLCANGVDGRRIREATGWAVHWGPVRAADIPAYLAAGGHKSDAMRRVSFPLVDRLEMCTVTLGFYGLLILLPVALFWRPLFRPAAASLVGLSYVYAVVHPWLPGRDGLAKSIPMTIIALGGLLLYTALQDPVPVPNLFNRILGITALSFFVSAEMQGMSPLMRGEQANWGWEAVVGVALGLVYWLVPLAAGWRG
jgi:2-polyprenyl-3-methyl-5-hydroxy-6-metoxy-1,4-benzoquinol methylase